MHWGSYGTGAFRGPLQSNQQSATEANRGPEFTRAQVEQGGRNLTLTTLPHPTFPGVAQVVEAVDPSDNRSPLPLPLPVTPGGSIVKKRSLSALHPDRAVRPFKPVERDSQAAIHRHEVQASDDVPTLQQDSILQRQVRALHQELVRETPEVPHFGEHDSEFDIDVFLNGIEAFLDADLEPEPESEHGAAVHTASMQPVANDFAAPPHESVPPASVALRHGEPEPESRAREHSIHPLAHAAEENVHPISELTATQLREARFNRLIVRLNTLCPDARKCVVALCACATLSDAATLVVHMRTDEVLGLMDAVASLKTSGFSEDAEMLTQLCTLRYAGPLGIAWLNENLGAQWQLGDELEQMLKERYRTGAANASLRYALEGGVAGLFVLYRFWPPASDSSDAELLEHLTRSLPKSTKPLQPLSEGTTVRSVVLSISKMRKDGWHAVGRLIEQLAPHFPRQAGLLLLAGLASANGPELARDFPGTLSLLPAQRPSGWGGDILGRELSWRHSSPLKEDLQRRYG